MAQFYSGKQNKTQANEAVQDLLIAESPIEVNEAACQDQILQAIVHFLRPRKNHMVAPNINPAIPHMTACITTCRAFNPPASSFGRLMKQNIRKPNVNPMRTHETFFAVTRGASLMARNFASSRCRHFSSKSILRGSHI